MIERFQVYVCKECGNMVEVLRVGGGTMVCCNQPMELQAVNTVDASREKHVPVIERTPDGVTVTVGSVAHPMEEKHFIEFIELVAGDCVWRQYLKPGDAPQAVFPPVPDGVDFCAREHCNLHGMWAAAVAEVSCCSACKQGV